MVLRCSLLGHDYGEPEVDREREERGSEVVLTVQTYEECARCGDRHVVSENTEITSLTPDERRGADAVDRIDERSTPPAGVRGDGTATGESDSVQAEANPVDSPAEDAQERPRTEGSDSAGRSGGPARGPGGPDTPQGGRVPASPRRGAGGPSGANTDGGTRPEESNAEPRTAPADPARTSDASSEPTTSSAEGTEGTDEGGRPEPTDDRNVPTDEDGDPIEDGEIIDDERERKPGEWPEPDDVGPPTGEGGRERWPDVDIDRVGGDEPGSGDAVGGATGDERDEREPTETGVDADVEAGATVTDSGTGIASAASAPVPGENPTVEPVDTEFYCPTCSFVAPGDHGSLRPGDICPDCGRGYIGERERK